MSVSLDSIIEIIKSKNIEFYVVEGQKKTVEAMAAIDSQVTNSLCYYVGEAPNHLVGINDSIIICKPELNVPPAMNNNTFIFTERPQLAFYCASPLFAEAPKAGIHTQVLINEKAEIGAGTSVGAFCVIDECKIGQHVIIESGVRINKGAVIGNDVHIQSSTVIGAAGMMWTWGDKEDKVVCAQTGSVIIEDNAIIGSNITIVRGAFPNKPTIIGRSTMIAHGTMIGHGVIIGLRNHFANNVSIAGTVTTGNDCFFGSGAVVRPHINIAAKTIIGAGAVVVKDVVEEGMILVGNPAQPMTKSSKNPSGVPAPY